MEHNEDKDKIILKRSMLPGVDMSISDFTMAHTVRVVVTKVTETMNKVGSKTYIGTLDQLDDGEVFQVGSLGLLYRVIKRINSYTAQRYYYQIQRLDGNSTTSVDLNAVKSGQKMKLVGRRTFQQMINYTCDLREDKAPSCVPEPVYPGLCGDQCTPAPPPSPQPRVEFTKYVVLRCGTTDEFEIVSVLSGVNVTGIVMLANNGNCYTFQHTTGLNPTITWPSYDTCEDCV